MSFLRLAILFSSTFTEWAGIKNYLLKSSCYQPLLSWKVSWPLSDLERHRALTLSFIRIVLSGSWLRRVSEERKSLQLHPRYVMWCDKLFIIVIIKYNIAFRSQSSACNWENGRDAYRRSVQRPWFRRPDLWRVHYARWWGHGVWSQGMLQERENRQDPDPARRRDSQTKGKLYLGLLVICYLPWHR